MPPRFAVPRWRPRWQSRTACRCGCLMRHSPAHDLRITSATDHVGDQPQQERREHAGPGPEMPGMCVHCETCGLSLALEHTGDVYSCDHFVEPAARARQHRRPPPARARRLRAAAGVRPREGRHAPALLPRLRRAVRLPRRVFEGPLHHHARRRARAHTCARASSASSGTSPSRCSRSRGCSPLDGLPPRACAGTPTRTRIGAATAVTCGGGRKWKHCHAAEPGP